ncbi:unnamed protein product, partial [Mesorhabditis spiculigera]
MDYCWNFNQAGASLHNAFDNMALMDQARKKIGDNTARVWLGGYWNGTSIKWDDNSAPEYNNLQNPNSGYLVLRLSDGKWDIVESGSYATACIGQDPKPQQVFPCDDEWLYSARLKSCYKLIGNFSGFTWPQAHQRCLSLGADLTSIHSDEENRIVVEMADTFLDIQDDFSKWTTACTWIGGKRTGPGKTDFVWTDGTKWDYTKWADNQPDNYGPEGQPWVQIYTTRHNEYGDVDSRYLNKWDDIYDKNGYNAVCKKPAKF